MLSAWQRPVRGRLVPLRCPFCSHCCPHPRGFTPLSSRPPGSWPFRSLNNLRLLDPALVLSVVCVHRSGLQWNIYFFFLSLSFWHVSFVLQLSLLEELIWCRSLWFWLKNLTLLLVRPRSSLFSYFLSECLFYAFYYGSICTKEV